MISWQEYVEKEIQEYRRIYASLPQKVIKEENLRLDITLNSPTQVVVFDFKSPYPKAIIVLHNLKLPDMKTEVFENVKYEDFSKISEDPRFVNMADGKTVDWIKNAIPRGIPKKLPPTWGLRRGPLEGGWLILINGDPLGGRLFFFRFLGAQNIDHLLIEHNRKKQKEKVETIVHALKRDAEAIPKGVDLRNKIIENTKRLEGQIEELSDRFVKEVDELHKFIGSSGKFMSLKAFTSEIEHLKETHIAKDVIGAEIKRLDEKIERGLEALNTRIEDLKAIKFWSKRTFLEIALAIWGAIVTLIAAGIIKF